MSCWISPGVHHTDREEPAGLDATDASSYRPISNLSVLSKLLERLVSRQLMEYIMSSADLLPARQSGFRPGHLTETAVLRVLSDISLAIDRGELAVLILLDLSTAFDTVDHDVLLQRLSVSTTSLPSGFSLACWGGHSTYDAEMLSQQSSRSCAARRRVQY